MKNRYDMAKLWYNEYVILILKKHKLYTYINNKFINFKYINKLREYHINYIIIDNLDIYIKEYEDNNYNLYYLKYNLTTILNNISKKIKERIDIDG